MDLLLRATLEAHGLKIAGKMLLWHVCAVVVADEDARREQAAGRGD
jgi:hypothetical protein